MSPIPTSSTRLWNNAAPLTGWWPKLSPTGRYLAYGNGHVWVIDLQTGHTFNAGSGWAGSGNTAQCPAGAWMSDREFALVSEAGLDRAIKLVDVVTETARDPGIPTATWPARVSRTAIYGRQAPDPNNWQYFRDGQSLTMDPALGRLAFDPIPTPNNVLMLAQPDRGWCGVLIDGLTGLLIRELPAVTAYGRQFDGPDGCYVAYPEAGLGAKALIIDGPAGVQRIELPFDQGMPALVWVKGVLWVWSVVWGGHNEQCFAFGRPIGESLGICIEMPNLDLNVAYDETQDRFILAGYAYGSPQYPPAYIEAHAVPATAARSTLAEHITPFTWPIVSPPAGRPLGVWSFNGRGNIGDGADRSGTKPILEGLGLNPDGSPWLRAENWDRLLAIWTSRWDSAPAMQYYPTADRIRLLARGYRCAAIEQELVDLYQAQRAANSQDFWPIEHRLATEIARQHGAPLIVYSDHPYVKNAAGDRVGEFDLLPVAEDWRAEGIGVICHPNMYPTERDANWEMANLVLPMLGQLAAAGFPVMLCLALYDQNKAWWPLREIAKKLNACIGLPVLGVELVGWGERASDPELDAWLDEWGTALLAAIAPFDRTLWPAWHPIPPPVVTPPIVVTPTPDPSPVPPAPHEGHNVPTVPIVIGTAAAAAAAAAALIIKHRHDVEQAIETGEAAIGDEARKNRKEREAMAKPDDPSTEG